MAQIERLLIVEDQRDDQLRASEIARAIGIGIIEARSSCAAARSLIEQGLRGEVSLPGAIVLDLDLGYESGHEFLRFWYMTPGASKIPLIVWSRLGGIISKSAKHSRSMASSPNTMAWRCFVKR